MKKILLIGLVVVLMPFALAQAATVSGSASLDDGPKMCTAQYQPVCGTYQVQCFTTPCYPVYKTYGNSCELSNNSNATFVHEGECTASEQGMASTSPEQKPYVPPKGCVAYNDGCNSCSVQPNGHTICTMMACSITNQHPGYCTAYTKPTTTTTVTTHTGTTSTVATPTATSASTTLSATTTAPTAVHEGFFARLWNTLRQWFGFSK